MIALLKRAIVGVPIERIRLHAVMTHGQIVSLQPAMEEQSSRKRTNVVHAYDNRWEIADQRIGLRFELQYIVLAGW